PLALFRLSRLSRSGSFRLGLSGENPLSSTDQKNGGSCERRRYLETTTARSRPPSSGTRDGGVIRRGGRIPHGFRSRIKERPSALRFWTSPSLRSTRLIAIPSSRFQ